jgi:hypothetical protein
MTPLLGFAPDLPATTPAVITDCVNLIPFENGMRAAPGPIAPLGVGLLAAACAGAAVLEKVDGTRRLFAGTAAAMYELIASVWTDRSKAGGYTGLPDSKWQFAQFGNVSLCANGVDKIQRSVTGAFTEITQAPRARVLFTVGYYVVALSLDGQLNGWACSDKFDDTTWTPSLSNLADSGELLSSAGQITAGARMGDQAIAYKKNSIFVGQFVESQTQTIDWRQIPAGNTGCVGPDALTLVDDMHFFIGSDNFWMFDGSRPVPVGSFEIRQWFYSNCNPDFLFKTQCIYDRQTNCVWVSYCGPGNTTIDRSLVYHVVSKKWGRCDFALQTMLNYITAGVTIDGLDMLSNTIDGLPNIPFDSQYWSNGGRVLSYFDSTNQVRLLSAGPGASSFTTGDVGDDQAVSMLSRLRLRYTPLYAPATAQVQCMYKFGSGDAFVNGSTGAVNDGKFDARQSGRWHAARFSFTGRVQIEQIDIKAVAAGQR